LSTVDFVVLSLRRLGLIRPLVFLIKVLSLAVCILFDVFIDTANLDLLMICTSSAILLQAGTGSRHLPFRILLLKFTFFGTINAVLRWLNTVLRLLRLLHLDQL